MTLATLTLSLGTVLITACGTRTQFANINPAPRPMRARSPSSVRVFAASTPNRPYIEVGMITGRQASEFSTHGMPLIVKEMRRKAAQMGCDALIVKGPHSAVESDLTGVLTETRTVSTLEGFWGVCAYWKPKTKQVSPCSTPKSAVAVDTHTPPTCSPGFCALDTDSPP